MVRSLWDAGAVTTAVFLADYAVNPLGVKSDDAIAKVVERWLSRAAAVSDSLLIACNTLSIRYHQLRESFDPDALRLNVVSMVDCFAAMVEQEASQLDGKNVLIVGTEFTAGQGLYADILDRVVPGTSVDTIAATELERTIARFGRWSGQGDASLTVELRQAIGDSDIVVLACTCFPMVKADLQGLFPGVVFLDPGAWSPGLVSANGVAGQRKLSLEVTGNAVSEDRVVEYAKSYLGTDSIRTNT